MKLILNVFRPQTLAILSLLTLLASCKASEDIAYFQDEPINRYEEVIFNTDIIYKSNDKLSIIVSSTDPIAAKPFNLPIISEGISEIVTQGSTKMQTYLVAQDGTIDFPVLGSIQIGGLSRTEATILFKKRLSEYVKDPIVNIRLINFTVTVLGEVRSPGTFTIEDEKISLTEALGLAGDLTIYGRRDNVLLIRENNGAKRYSKLNLASVNVVNEAGYYLQQDDVIYVTPNKPRIRTANYTQNNSVIIAAVAALTAIAALIIN